MTSRAPLDPIVLAEERRRAAAGLDPTAGLPMADRRERALRTNADLWQHAGRPGPRTETSEWVVPVAGARDVRVRMHRPPGVGAQLPGVIALFGGAFRQGGIDYPSF